MEENEKKLEPVVAQESDSREVVSWFIPRQGEEVVSYYVHSQPMPSAHTSQSTRQESDKPRKPRKVGLWVFLGIAALLIILAVVGSFFFVPDNVSAESSGETDDTPSSIIDIFTETGETKIPRCQEKTDYRMTLTSETPEEELSASDIFAKVNPAVVMIVSEQQEKAYLGTGIMMTPDGYLLTNAHVVSGGETCCIIMDTGDMYDCELVGIDEEEDLAVLHAIDVHDLPTAEFANSDYCGVGDTVYAIGNPLGVQFRCTLTNGIISGVQRELTIDGTNMTMLQTTAAVNNGNSGGPLINAYGQVIGIVTLKWGNTSYDTTTATIEGMGFAIPTVNARYVVNALLKNGEFEGLPTLGITVRVSGTGDSTKVIVQEISEGYGGEKAGVQVGDVILSADGSPVSSIEDLLQARDLHTVGDTLTLTLNRQGETITVDVPIYAPIEAE